MIKKSYTERVREMYESYVGDMRVEGKSYLTFKEWACQTIIFLREKIYGYHFLIQDLKHDPEEGLKYQLENIDIPMPRMDSENQEEK